MKPKRKVTYTLYINGSDGESQIRRNLISRRIRAIAAMKGEKMAHWAKELKVTRQAVYHVVDGRRRTKRTREFIENRLGQRFWSKETCDET